MHINYLKLQIEKYVDYIKNVKHLNSFIKFRVWGHKLLIEKGRRKIPIIQRNERICKTCNRLEDESHLLIDCDNYNYDRLKEFKDIFCGYLPKEHSSVPHFIFSSMASKLNYATA